MNAPAEQIAKRRLEQKELQALVSDFIRAEKPLIDAAQVEFAHLLRDAIPRLQGHALESGCFTGKITIELEVDLSPKKKAIKLRGISTPQPWSLERSKVVKY